MAWFAFTDMRSGGHRKLTHEKLYTHANNEREAVKKFERTFYRDPDYVTCSCCGADFSVWECEVVEVFASIGSGEGRTF